MDLIFYNGENLYSKDRVQPYQKCIDYLEKDLGKNLLTYQKEFLHSLVKGKEAKYNIYGDDFKIEIIPKNIQGDCVLTIKGYDENQKFENETRIGFSKDELNQLIALLQTVSKSL